MKKLLLILVFLFSFFFGSNFVFGQAFTGATGSIPDNNTATDFNVTVQNLPISPATLSASFGVVGVNINITHTWDEDLDVYLVHPDGTSLELFTDVGGSSDNFTNTTITMLAPAVVPSTGSPYTNRYKPEAGGNLLTAFSGKAGNGTWKLRITDDVAGDVGSVTSWSVTFGFINYTAYSIPDDGLWYQSTITTSGLPSAINGTWGLTTVVYDIAHTYDSDLDIWVRSPSSVDQALSTANGAGGDDYRYTRITAGTGTNVSSGTAPFYGSYNPEGATTDFATENNGQNPNGTWAILFQDAATPDAGIIYGWALVFPENTCATVAGTATANSTICSGSTTSAAVAGYTGGSTLQWEQSPDNSTWADVTGGSGATTATYTTPALTATTYYRCKVTNGCVVYSNSVTKTVNPASVGGTASASSSSICNGNTVVLTLAGYTGSIQWQSSPAGCSSWSNIGGATTTPYTTAAISATTCFRAVVTSGVCASANSSSTTVSVVTCYLQPAAGGSTSYTTCSGNFYDDGGQGGSSTNNAANNYSHSNNNSVLTFYPSIGGNVIQVAFSVFLTEAGYDYLYVYNGNSTSAPLIGIYDGSTSPGIITSCAGDGSLTFKFYADGLQNRTGWEAAVSCVAAGTPCYFQPVAGGSTSYTTCSGNFYDDGGQGGSSTNNAANNYSHSNNNSVLTFYPSIGGNVIQVAFSVFLTEAGYDYLYVYNGNSTSAPLIGIYDGSTSPGIITSCAGDGSLTFKFYADGLQNRTGWEAAVSCVAAGSTTNTWNGSASTVWGTAANWSLGIVPTFCHNVVIPNVGTDPIVTSAVSVNNLTIQNAGILQANAAITVSGTFTIDNGGIYKHNNTTNPKTTIFNGTESFASNSTFELLAWPGISTYLHNGSTVAGDAMNSTAYGNLIINWSGAGPTQWEWDSYMTLSSNPRIAGTLTIVLLGTNDIHLSDNGGESHQIGGLVINGAKLCFKGQVESAIEGNSTLTILGDFTMNGGTFVLEEDGELPAVGTVIENHLVVNGTFTQTGGTIQMNEGEQYNNQGINKIYLNGNVVLNGGSITQNNLGAGGLIYWQVLAFDKSGTQTYSENGTNTITKCAYWQLSNSTLVLNTNMTIPSISSSTTIYNMLQILGTVNTSNYKIYPTTNYPESGVWIYPAGRLQTTNTNGFYTVNSSATTLDDSRTTKHTVTIDVGGYVEYNGTASQAITNSVVKNADGTAVTPSRSYGILDIFNTSAGGSALTMAGSVSTDQLRLRDGVVSTGANTLTVLNTTAGGSGSIQNHSMASYVNTGATGNLRRYLTATGSYDFPAGNGNTDAYELMNINITSGNTATYFDVRFDNPANATGTGLPLSDAGQYQYDVVLNNGGINPTTGNANGGIWTVTPNAGTANYNVSLYGRNYGNAGTEAHTVLKRVTFGPGAWTLNGTYSSSTLTAPITAVRNGLSGFSQFAIGRSNVALPVQLLQFSGKCDNNTILNWSTASETNNDFFTIEKSSDAQWFSVLGTVPGAGNSSTIKNYSLTDFDPLKGKTFYRLSQTDFNGSKETFAPISVSCEDENGFDVIVNSNPVTDGTIYLSVNAAEGERILIVLTDILGRDIHSEVITAPGGNFLVTVCPEETPAQGMYIITASSGNDEFISRKVVVK